VAFVLVLIGVVVHATIFSRAVEIQKELHTKQTALETLSSMHESADGLPEKIASFNAAVTEQKERVDTLTTDWREDLEVRIAQLNELLEPGYRGVTPAEESAPTLQSPVQ
jgi:peptidoglycan hydrolase CwlO-like protein